MFRCDMVRFDDRDLIFLDESIVNEKTSWRHRAYAPVGHVARYTMNIRRGKTWALLARMTLDGWLPCIEVREGYFKLEDFLDWLRNSLIPTVRAHYTGRTMVVILNNCSIHVNPLVE